jgi:RimJ/RimL family protein N-acetyltransferase
MKPPILTGPRVILRPIKLSDAISFSKWCHDQAVYKHFNASVHNISPAVERKWIRHQWQDKNQVNWAILNEAKKYIGNTRLIFDQANSRARWGIIIGDKKEWGKGYAQEVIKIVCEYFFRIKKWHRIDLTVEMLNTRAVAAYQKAGFILEGVQRKSRINPVLKTYVDVGMMGILREDWLKKH